MSAGASLVYGVPMTDSHRDPGLELAARALAVVLDLEADDLRADSPLADLGADSVARVQWADVVEELASARRPPVLVDDTPLGVAATLGGLAEHLAPQLVPGSSRTRRREPPRRHRARRCPTSPPGSASTSSPALLERALTHRSYAYENGGLPTNERLEFLGDSVLGLVVTDTLYRTHPDLPEGQLAKLRAAVVNAQALAGIGRELGLGEHLLLGRGEETTGGRDKSSILADTVEAVIGAVYLDHGPRGRDRARSTGSSTRSSRSRPRLGAGLDWKTSLQELTAARASVSRSTSSTRAARTTRRPSGHGSASAASCTATAAAAARRRPSRRPRPRPTPSSSSGPRRGRRRADEGLPTEGARTEGQPAEGVPAEGQQADGV